VDKAQERSNSEWYTPSSEAFSFKPTRCQFLSEAFQFHAARKQICRHMFHSRFSERREKNLCGVAQERQNDHRDSLDVRTAVTRKLKMLMRGDETEVLRRDDMSVWARSPVLRVHTCCDSPLPNAGRRVLNIAGCISECPIHCHALAPLLTTFDALFAPRLLNTIGLV
jgi:hypothetical protein